MRHRIRPVLAVPPGSSHTRHRREPQPAPNPAHHMKPNFRRILVALAAIALSAGLIASCRPNEDGPGGTGSGGSSSGSVSGDLQSIM